LATCHRDSAWTPNKPLEGAIHGAPQRLLRRVHVDKNDPKFAPDFSTVRIVELMLFWNQAKKFSLVIVSFFAVALT
jgi:hypothetical protein